MIKENIFRNTFNHCIFLHEVKRRSEIDLINCINGVSNLEGTVRVLYQRVKRPLPLGPQPVRLCPQKCDCVVYNATQSFNLQSDASYLMAEDSDEKIYLNTLSVARCIVLETKFPNTRITT